MAPWRQQLHRVPDELVSFPTLLQQAGYTTAYIGKWHMGEDNDNPRPGFDHWISHKGQGKYYDNEFNINGKRETKKGYYTHVVTDMAIDCVGNQDKKPCMLILGHKAPHSFYTPEKKYEHLFDSVKVAYPEVAFHLEDKPGWIRSA